MATKTIAVQTLNPAQVSIAAAHDITPRVIGTWYPQLPRTPRVLVPVQLDALVVRPGENIPAWADCQMTIATGNANRRQLLPPPFQELTKGRPTGVYLQWALPDALTHGDTGSNSVSFPAIPDRWLVIRISPAPDNAARRAVQGWVLRAGDQTPTATDLDQWQETGNPQSAGQPALTSMGFGDPAWAAYYDNVVNRLAFYDPLDQPQTINSGPLAYLVCGWFFDPTQDPLGTTELHSLTDFNQRMATLNWELKPGELDEAIASSNRYVKGATMLGLQTLEAVGEGSYASNVTAATNAAVSNTARVSTGPRIISAQLGQPYPTAVVGSSPAPLDASGHPVGGEYISNGNWWPQLTLYHGSVVAIGWPTVGYPGNEEGLLSGEVGGPPAASDITVCVGNTTNEALATAVAQTDSAPDQARVLEAFLLGALRDLDQPDGQARVDALLHASAFATRDGGFVNDSITQQGLPPQTPPIPSTPVTPSDAGIFAQAGGTQAAVNVGNQAVVDKTGAAIQGISVAEGASEKILGSTVMTGRLSDTLRQITAGQQAPAPTPPSTITVKRGQPRYFEPADPVVLLQGGARSFKHGSDGRYSQDGNLLCRLTGFCVTELACNASTGQPIRPSIAGDDLLERGIENGSVPIECEDLLRETVLLDPGSASAAATTMQAINQANNIVLSPSAQSLTQKITVEQTVWWATRNPVLDAGPIIANSGLQGLLPSPIAVTPPVRPWTPIHLDWEVQFVPSGPGGIMLWNLDEIDFDPNQQQPPDPKDTTSGVIVKGRAHLTGGAATSAAQAIRTALAQAASAGSTAPLPPSGYLRYQSGFAQLSLGYAENLSLSFSPTYSSSSGLGSNGGAVPADDQSILADLATTLEQMDVLSGPLDGFLDFLRGGYTGDGKSVPAQGSPVPSPFFPVREGFLRILRLRLVDGYGQFVDLAGSSDTTFADPSQILNSQPMQLDSNHPGIEVLPPRFTSPARLWFRYTPADGSSSTSDATSVTPPVCGYLLPNHLDGDLEFFDATGLNLGVVRPDTTAGIVWEDAPGVPSTVGQTPARAIPNQFLAGIAQGLLDWGLADVTFKGGREDALSALLRIIDSTLWAVDPFGHIGDEHMSLLVGHPVVVMRARLFLEVNEPITPDLVKQMSLPVRLGALTQWQDGLLGYFVNDDYRTLYCADAAVAGFAREVGPNRGFLQQINLVPDFYQTFSDDITGTGVTQGDSPVQHPYVDASGIRVIQPNQEVKLTLLVSPNTVVHATTGLLPRKGIGMRRDWIAAALAQLSPTFRFGPVLVDPKTIRMPVPSELQGTWSWDHRADISKWSEDAVTNATSDALFPPDPTTGTEGWLRFEPAPANPPTTTSTGSSNTGSSSTGSSSSGSSSS
ncbi:MAG: hypothetical protein WBQ10_12420 [Terriglobales bacterium]